MAATDSDTALYERCKRQDRAAFAELFERHHARVFRAAYLISRETDAADDIAQLVFEELFTAFRRFDTARPFLPWLYRIVHNVSMDYLRRNRRGTLPLLNPDSLLGPDPDPGPADRAEQAEQREVVWAAMSRLPDHQRAVLTLRYYAGLNEAEMADTLNIRRGTVKSRLHRAQEALASLLAGERPARRAPFTPPATGDVAPAPQFGDGEGV